MVRLILTDANSVTSIRLIPVSCSQKNGICTYGHVSVHCLKDGKLQQCLTECFSASAVILESISWWQRVPNAQRRDARTAS